MYLESPNHATAKCMNDPWQRMLDRCAVLVVSLESARHYAAIRLELKGAGKPIPSNDMWIAALSRQHAIPVMSRDSHFDFAW
jgi:predicted nucleic acid-binding protein